MLENCHRKIEELHQKLTKLETENRLLLTQKSQDELERIQQKKQSMTLNLKHKTSDVQTDTQGLTASNGAQTTETETCDTFHTANSDCSFASALPSPFPPRQNTIDESDVEEKALSTIGDMNAISLPDHQDHQQQEQQHKQPQQNDGKTLMSDSGVCLENNNNSCTSNNNSCKVPEPQTSSTTSSSSQNTNNLMKHSCDGDNLSTHSSQLYYEQLLSTQMEKLREKIAERKAEIMKILEMGGEKTRLDELINDLQELQKDYVKYEMKLDHSRGEHFKRLN